MLRKFLAGSLMAASVTGGALAASAILAGPAVADGACSSGSAQPIPLGPLGTLTVNPGNGSPSTSGTLAVCSSGSPVIDGSVTASGNAQGPSGYVIAQSAQPAGTPPQGYIGVESANGEQLAVVGCSTGAYNDGSGKPTGPSGNDGTADTAGNNVILDSNGQGSATTPASVVTGQNCGLQNQPQPQP